MRKQIVILFLLTAIGCSKNTSTSKYFGSWNGSYSDSLFNVPHSFDSGTLNIVVNADNSVTATLKSIFNQAGGSVIFYDIVDASSGNMSPVKSGSMMHPVPLLLGHLSADLKTGSGRLSFAYATVSKWQVAKN